MTLHVRHAGSRERLESARWATILVASPKLFEPECKSPRQMKLANALCRYVWRPV